MLKCAGFGYIFSQRENPPAPEEAQADMEQPSPFRMEAAGSLTPELEGAPAAAPTGREQKRKGVKGRMKPVKGRKGPLFWVKKRRAAAMNDTRFTQRAQEALRQAQQSAAQLGHGYVGSEHLLLAWREKGAAWPPGSCARPAWSTTPCGRR